MEKPEQPSLEDHSVRKRFTWIVFLILTFEFFVLVLLIYPFVYCEEFTQFLDTAPWLAWTILLYSILFFTIILCSTPAFPQFPFNLMLLQVLVLCIGIIVGVISYLFTIQIIYIAVVETLVIAFVLTVLALIVSDDITETSWIVTICMWLAVIATIFWSALYFIHQVDFINYLWICWNMVNVVIICVYLLYDTQIIMNGRRRPIGPHDYVLAVMHLFLDIAFFVIYMLQCKDDPIFGLLK